VDKKCAGVPSQVITKEIDGKKCEPFEEAQLEVPEEHMGPAMDLLGQRKGQMLDMAASTGEGATQRLKYRIPTRGGSDCSVHCMPGCGSVCRGCSPAGSRACVWSQDCWA